MDDKIKVLIASVLKPANDVRSFLKIGKSLAQTNKYEVNIIGFESKKKCESQNIFLHPLFNFQRDSPKRLLASFFVLKKHLQLKPKLIIVNTPELLPVIYLIKILFGTKIIYDIQENYLLNIQYSKTYSSFSKKIFSVLLKKIEKLSARFVDAYFLAEEVYEHQLNFIHKKPYIKLLNKTILQRHTEILPKTFSIDQDINFIVSGTLGHEYGTLEAIHLCRNLHKIKENITLTIIGYSADYEYLNRIKETIEDKDYIHLITDSQPIPQESIIKQIKASDVALLPYQLNENIAGRFPTKIYDYAALNIPMVIPPHNEWNRLLERNQAGITINYLKPDPELLLRKLTNNTFYDQPNDQDIYWKDQEQIMTNFIANITPK